MAADGYEWLDRFDKIQLQKLPLIRALLRFYFKPFFFERLYNGLIYKILGVHIFGKFLPTGGINIRRWTKKKMPSYTLRNTTLNSSIAFRYKSCFFESLHMPFFMVLLWRALWWYFDQNNIDLAVELMVVNAIFNIYPIMHQRYTRVRIERLMSLKRS